MEEIETLTTLNTENKFHNDELNNHDYDNSQCEERDISTNDENCNALKSLEVVRESMESLDVTENIKSRKIEENNGFHQDPQVLNDKFIETIVNGNEHMFVSKSVSYTMSGDIENPIIEETIDITPAVAEFVATQGAETLETADEENSRKNNEGDALNQNLQKTYNLRVKDLRELADNNSDLISERNSTINIKQQCTFCAKGLEVAYFNLEMFNGETYKFCSQMCGIMYQKQHQPKLTWYKPTNILVQSTSHKLKNQPIILQKKKQKQQIITKLPPVRNQKNVATMCTIIKRDVGINAAPDVTEKSIQTDTILPTLLPLPVPIYVPVPMWMYSMPFPVPFPFPLPIPVPIFIPTTRNAYEQIAKNIKELPSNPIEAEIVEIAKLIADEPEVNENAQSDGGLINTDVSLESNIKQLDIENEITVFTGTFMPKAETSTHITVPDTCGVKRSKKQSKRTTKKQAKAAMEQLHEKSEINHADTHLKFIYSLNMWKTWITSQNIQLPECSSSTEPKSLELLNLSPYDLNYLLCKFIKEMKKPNGEQYTPDTVYYLCLGIQLYLNANGRFDNIFCDVYYEPFINCLDNILKAFPNILSDANCIVTRVEEEHLWESKQLGAHSPHILLNTLLYFNTKYYNLKTANEHEGLAFSHIMKHWKGKKAESSRDVVLRWYGSQTLTKKYYEQHENSENPLRCPVKLYEFYLSKCPESVKTRGDVFYLEPERSCVSDSPFWYSVMPLKTDVIEKTLNRVKLIREINVALLHNSE